MAEPTSDGNDNSGEWVAPVAVIGAALLVALVFVVGYWTGLEASDEPLVEQRSSEFLRCLTANGVPYPMAEVGPDGDVVFEPDLVVETDLATRRSAMSACGWIAPELARSVLGADLLVTHGDPRSSGLDRVGRDRDPFAATCRQLAQGAIPPDDPAYDMLRRLCRTERD